MDTNSSREDRSASTVDHDYSLTTMWDLSSCIYLNMEPHTTLSIEIRLSVPDLVSQLWRKIRFFSKL